MNVVKYVDYSVSNKQAGMLVIDFNYTWIYRNVDLNYWFFIGKAEWQIK